MIGYRLNNRGRYQCNYCGHPSYKNEIHATLHRDSKHHLEAEIERRDVEIAKLKNTPPKIEEKIVYRDKPQAEEKYWYGPAGIYCSSCKTVIRKPGIPVGQTVENTPCTCGNTTLMLIMEFK